MRQAISPLSRIVAGVIGVIWIVAGIAAVILGIPAHQWGTVLLGVLAVYFGSIWWHVARKGRYVAWPFGTRDS
ncbi:MAG TPA: hypothetical protein VFI41_00725 [Gemmatimonadales bacterium]|jgi:uncharacterized membrane protein HdeD (DUF308 family)|nr:hypothetical protein [Gemmatimonadales bacterium]